MNTIGQTIKQLRRARGVTQEELAGALNVTYQAVSKWENETAQPDIMMMPALASYFGVTIDELFGYKLDVMTNKERMIRYMDKNGILVRGDVDLKNGGKSSYYINTENFSTNAQLSRIGEVFADCIRENHLEFDALVGLAYHGIAFAIAAATALHTKYGKTCSYCYDRRVADSRGRPYPAGRGAGGDRGRCDDFRRFGGGKSGEAAQPGGYTGSGGDCYHQPQESNACGNPFRRGTDAGEIRR